MHFAVVDFSVKENNHVKLLPIHGRKGIVGYSKVDDDVFEWASKMRWHLGSKRYLLHTKYLGTTGRRNTSVKLHRLITGAQPGEVVDHVDRDIWNNQRVNLRRCSARQNAVNTVKRAGMTSSYKGVHLKYKGKRKQRWCAAPYGPDGRQVQLYFSNERHAALAHTLWAVDVYGEFANPEFNVVLHTKKKPAA